MANKNPIIITRHRSSCNSEGLKDAEKGGRMWNARNTNCYVRKIRREISTSRNKERKGERREGRKQERKERKKKGRKNKGFCLK
jgi:hypothetical protein